MEVILIIYYIHIHNEIMSIMCETESSAHKSKTPLFVSLYDMDRRLNMRDWFEKKKLRVTSEPRK